MNRKPGEYAGVRASAISPAGYRSVTVPDMDLFMEREMGALYENINGLLLDGSRRAIQFIGSRSGEGTTTIVRQFAGFIDARLEKSILILDFDTVAADGGRKADSDATSAREIGFRGVGRDNPIFRVSGSRVCISSIGGKPSKQHCPPTELIAQLKALFDYVLIDSTPVSESQESLSFCSAVDGVVLVVEAERTRGPVIENAKAKVLERGGRILGVVLNKRRFYIPEWVYKYL